MQLGDPESHPITRDALRQALKSWHSLKKLGAHPLADLALVDSQATSAGYTGTDVGRGLALRAVLNAAVDTLKPDPGMPDPGVRSWRPYVILSEQYLQGRSPNWVRAQMYVSKTTYHSEQRRALDLLVDVLQRWEMEQRAQGAAAPGKPAPGEAVTHVPFLAPPRPSHALVGRDVLLDRIKQQIMNGNHAAPMALSGLPGVGKTTLAVALAHDPAVREHYPDGVLWVGLGRNPNPLFWLGIWAAAVGISDEAIAGYSDVNQRAAAVHAAIGLRRMLLVIDDAWQAEAALTFKVGGPNCAHLLTTRLANVALDFARDTVIVVQELSPEQGMELLAEIAPRAVEAAPQDLQDLTRTVGGLPLAIILMGSYLRKESHGGQTRRLHDALRRLHTAEARLQLEQPHSPLEVSSALDSGTSLSLQAAIDLSSTSLDPVTRRVLYDLSLFKPKPNTFSEEAALAVTGGAVAAIDALVDHGLLENIAPDRYTMHQTIADHAALNRADGEGLGRFVRFYVQYVEDWQREHALLEPELTNILTALEYAGSADLRTWLMRGVHALHSFLETRGLYQLDEQYLERARQAAERADDAQTRARILHDIGDLYVKMGWFGPAQQSLHEAAELAERVGDRELMGKIQLGLGLAGWYSNGEIDGGDYIERARHDFREIGDRHNEGFALNGLAYASIERAEFGRARLYLDQALRVCRESGNRRGEGWAHYHLGTAYLPLGDFDRALSHWEQCKAIYLELEDRRGEGWIIYSMGRHQRQKGDYEKAKASFEYSRVIFEEIGEQFGAAFATHNVGLVCSDLGEDAQSVEQFTQALSMFQTLGVSTGEHQAYYHLGLRLRRLGDYPGARDYFEQVLRFFYRLNHPLGQCKSLANLGLVYQHLGRSAEAYSYCRQAVDRASHINARPTEAHVTTCLGHVLLDSGCVGEAADAYREAAGIRLELGQRHLALDPQAGLVEALLAQGEGDEALAVAMQMMGSVGDTRSLTRLERSLAGTDGPGQILLACYDALQAAGDPRARPVLRAADLLLRARSERLDDPALRHSCLENVAAHRRILELAAGAQ